jgi:hypothetical protein
MTALCTHFTAQFTPIVLSDIHFTALFIYFTALFIHFTALFIHFTSLFTPLFCLTFTNKQSRKGMSDNAMGVNRAVK